MDIINHLLQPYLYKWDTSILKIKLIIICSNLMITVCITKIDKTFSKVMDKIKDIIDEIVTQMK
jgi:hypothetical protein